MIDSWFVRFTNACQGLISELRLYRVGQGDYADLDNRDKALMRKVNRVEGEETQQWATLMSEKATSVTRTSLRVLGPTI